LAEGGNAAQRWRPKQRNGPKTTGTAVLLLSNGLMQRFPTKAPLMTRTILSWSRDAVGGLGQMQSHSGAEAAAMGANNHHQGPDVVRIRSAATF